MAISCCRISGFEMCSLQISILSWLETLFLGRFTLATGDRTGPDDEEKLDTELSDGEMPRANEKVHGSPAVEEDGEENCEGV